MPIKTPTAPTLVATFHGVISATLTALETQIAAIPGKIRPAMENWPYHEAAQPSMDKLLNFM
jgi:hypothetical protein